jgi:hypothetical protein
MTFFYDLNKRLADLAKKQDLNENMDTASRDAMIKQAQKDTMSKVLKQHGKTDQQIKRKIARTFKDVKEDDFEEGNEFSGELAQARAAGAKQFKVDGKSYPVKEEGGTPMTPKQKSFAKLAPPVDKITFADKIAGAKKEVDEMLGDVAAEAIKGAIGKKKESRSKGTAFDPEVAKGMFAHKDEHPRHDVKDTGYSKRYTRKTVDTDVDAGDDVKTDAPKKKGRPKGPDKGPERVTAKSYKYKSGRPAKTKEDLDTDGVMMTRQSNMSSEDRDPGADSGEYDREGDMAKEQMHTIMSAAKELHSMLKDEENLPEWVQKKITLAKEYIDSARDYMSSQHAERAEEEPVTEKAVSKKQQKFMGMAHAMQKGEKIKGASPELKKVAKTMKKGDVEDFAKTKHKGLPEKVKAKDKKEESVEETADTPKEKKSSGGFQFGKGVYETFNKKYTQLLSEGMNVSVNMGTGADGQATKNITVSAEGDDAEALAKLLQMAGIGGHSQKDACGTCGKAPCGCESELDENSPDWPTNTETSNDALQYSGGLNKPKSTGQTTTPVIASQLRRQVSMEEGVELERSLFKLYQNYKAQ